MLVLSFFAFLMLIILGIVFGKFKIVVKKLDFALNGKVKSKNDYKIKFGIYLFGKIKILGITVQEEYISFLGFKLSLNKVYEKLLEKEDIEIDKDAIKENIKLLNMKFEKLNLNLKLGTDSTLITSFLTFVVATTISFILRKSITKYSQKKHRFIITPIYENGNKLDMYLELVASFKVLNVIKLLINLNKLSKTEHNSHKMKLKLKEIKI